MKLETTAISSMLADICEIDMRNMDKIEQDLRSVISTAQALLNKGIHYEINKIDTDLVEGLQELVTDLTSDVAFHNAMTSIITDVVTTDDFLRSNIFDDDEDEEDEEDEEDKEDEDDGNPPFIHPDREPSELDKIIESIMKAHGMDQKDEK